MSHIRVVLATVLLVGAVPAGAQTDVPAQASRGKEMFFKTARPRACGNCHALAGEGTAVGPDLKVWARFPPRATAMAIMAKLTDKVVEVRPKQGEAFPALKVDENEKTLTVYDLATLARRELARGDVAEVSSNTKWRHPPGQEQYTADELADVVSFIRWAGAKDRKPVSPEDVQ